MATETARKSPRILAGLFLVAAVCSVIALMHIRSSSDSTLDRWVSSLQISGFTLVSKQQSHDAYCGVFRTDDSRIAIMLHPFERGTIQVTSVQFLDQNGNVFPARARP